MSSRWNKSIVVPLDTLCKEKENTNRPTVARSVGTVGKWGKMGFTSTRTYALSVLPASMAAAVAAAGVTSPAQSPASPLDDDLSLSVPEPPKPKKFFKSRNTAPPEVIAQMIQQIPNRVSTSPIRDTMSSAGGGSSTSITIFGTPLHEPIRLKIGKSNSAERKKKSKKKVFTTPPAVTDATFSDEGGVNGTETKPTPEPKTKKKKEKELKPEAPPSRVLGRARKVVNYCEVDEDDSLRAPKSRVESTVVPASKVPVIATAESTLTAAASATTENILNPSEELPPPQSLANAAGAASATPTTPACKTPEHPPIVLRISKGTSRLVSTDSEEQPNNSPAQQQYDAAECTTVATTTTTKSRLGSIDEIEIPATTTNLVSGATTVTAISTPKIILKPPKPPPKHLTENTTTLTGAGAASLDTKSNSALTEDDDDADVDADADAAEEDEPPEINYCTVKISPDKPPKERLKLIIKTDVIRNAIAKAAAVAAAKEAAAAAAAAAGTTSVTASGDECRSEKKSKSKKHKHLKHAAVEQLLPTPVIASSGVVASEFKTPSPHLALSEHQHQRTTVISPTARSEHDFDSQSSVLGSISSKGNSTPQPLAQAVQEESCVIHSRGSSVITSDLETSQHSSLVAPPSDIESRLESMMMTMDGAAVGNETLQRAPAVEEPLQEDILAVLRGEEDNNDVVGDGDNAEMQTLRAKLNGVIGNEEKDSDSASNKKRVTRGRGRKAAANTTAAAAALTTVNIVEEKVSPPATTRTRGRGRQAAAVATPSSSLVETASSKRNTRRGAAKKLESENVETPMEVDVAVASSGMTALHNSIADADALDSGEPLITQTRRGRSVRSNNNNVSNTNNNNNNINKIAANLSAKAEATKSATPSQHHEPQRNYSRKRKNQQVTQVVPSSTDIMGTEEEDDDDDDDDELLQHATPAKIPHTELDPAMMSTSLDNADCSNNSNNSSSTLINDGSSSSPSPPRRDYKFKDKFKRTLTLDTQVANNNNNAQQSVTETLSPNLVTHQVIASSTTNEDEQQRGAVKLVISKKKGSIFKSRALVPSDQADHATVTKRHLYKHSWDAALEANGAGNGSDASNASPSNAAGGKTSESNHASSGKSVAEAIYADFGDSNSTNNHSAGGGGGSAVRGDSPSLGKLTRVIKTNPQASTNLNSNAYDLDDAMSDAPEAIISVRVDRKAKEYYTVVRNVKTAHQIQEIGEYQEMDDDVEYILDALQPHNPPATRCLSALQLATKCMTPAFRMHVRAHGVVTKFFKALSDANKDLSLGLCTSAIMYILSQEGLNMDLDRDSLELMMNLLEAEGVAASSDRANYERNKQKVRELCEEIKAQGKATHLNVDSITVGTLAMETLLSLTSKRAGDWFKEDLRKLGGLEHIIKTISEFCRPVIECSNDAISEIVWTQALLDNMQTVARCLRVLENVTQHNEANQNYMLTYANGAAINTLCLLYRLCDRVLLVHPTIEDNAKSKEHPGVVMRELLTPVLKVLISLTHSFNATQATLGAELLGKREDIIDTSFHLLLIAPNYIPDRCVFELSILVLMLLINLSMYTISNRANIMKAFAPPEYIVETNGVTAIQALLEYFYKCEEFARLVEKNTDAFLENNEKTKKKQEEVEETVNNLMQRAGHHMEHTLKGSYAGLLIGHLITDSEEYEAIVRKYLRSNSFKEIIGVLEKYHTFMNLTASSEATVVAHIKSTKKIIDNFKKRDYIYENSDDNALPLNLEMTQHHQHNSRNASSSSSSSGSSINNNVANNVNAATVASGAGTTNNNAAATASSSSSSMPRVYKTYSHR